MPKLKDYSKNSNDLISSQRELILEQENIKLRDELEKALIMIQDLSATKKITVDVTTEQLIAESQLEKIKAKSDAGKELTLEEIKKYDILVKNKRLSQGEPTLIPEWKKIDDNVSDDKLLEIASYKNGK